MRFRLRTLLIVLALGPPVLAGGWRWWAKSAHHRSIKGGIGGSFVTEHYNDGTSVTRRSDVPEVHWKPAGGEVWAVSTIRPVSAEDHPSGPTPLDPD